MGWLGLRVVLQGFEGETPRWEEFRRNPENYAIAGIELISMNDPPHSLRVRSRFLEIAARSSKHKKGPTVLKRKDKIYRLESARGEFSDGIGALHMFWPHIRDNVQTRLANFLECSAEELCNPRP